MDEKLATLPEMVAQTPPLWNLLDTERNDGKLPLGGPTVRRNGDREAAAILLTAYMSSVVNCAQQRCSVLASKEVVYPLIGVSDGEYSI
mmetsp:Transcript_23710/g.27971  ORF Transcript_23710/g.27971 Transcript_23710/m.27971 type:complete len:89 (-) Transcript_23710:52-318(-)